jgi:hypothetical protein
MILIAPHDASGSVLSVINGVLDRAIVTRFSKRLMRSSISSPRVRLP